MDDESAGTAGEASAERPSIRVFMSYRRRDSRHFSGRFHDKLIAAFGHDNVFRDIDSIKPGTDFVEVIVDTLQDVDVVVVLIGPEWADGVDATGDFVRLEIGHALESGRPVIPVLIEDTELPEGITTEDQKSLTAVIGPFPRLN